MQGHSIYLDCQVIKRINELNDKLPAVVKNMILLKPFFIQVNPERFYRHLIQLSLACCQYNLTASILIRPLSDLTLIRSDPYPQKGSSCHESLGPTCLVGRIVTTGGSSCLVGRIVTKLKLSRGSSCLVGRDDLGHK